MSGTTAPPGAPAPRGQRAPAPGARTITADRAATRGLAARRTRQVLNATRASLQGTPGRLRLAGIVSVVACLAFAGLAGWALQQRASSLAQARVHADQLVRIQRIASDLVEADSQFTNGYLTFGQDSPAQLEAYDQAVAEASRLIAEASGAEPGDAADLATVNDALSQYTARVAAARANNIQGYQVGVGYLRQASSLLRSDASPVNMLPTLDRLVTVNAHRVDDAFASSRRATWLMVAAGVLGFGGLVVVQGWVALRSHRVLNPPLVGATAAVLVVLIGGGGAMAFAQARADQVKDNSYAATLALANARISAYVGKSYQSVTLIYIGTGGDYPTSQKAYQEQVATARSALASAAATGTVAGSIELARWTAANEALTAAARKDWTRAAARASSTGPGSVNALFTAFDDATRPVLDRQVIAVDDGLSGANTALVVLAGLSVLLGLAAAAAGWLGISMRLEEYR